MLIVGKIASRLKNKNDNNSKVYIKRVLSGYPMLCARHHVAECAITR